MKVFIDAGHNYSGADTGAVGNGLREQDVNFGIAERLKNLLIAAGHEVRMSRERLTENLGTTVSESLRLRSSRANEWSADLFVSIHCNSFNGVAEGTETLLYSLGSQSETYAVAIQQSITSRLGTVDRGVKERKDLSVLRQTVMPAVLIETAFIDNPEDGLLLKNRQGDFARAIFDGITGAAVGRMETIQELTDIDAIVWEFVHRGIVTDSEGMVSEMQEYPDGRLYWLARKALQYIRSRNI